MSETLFSWGRYPRIKGCLRSFRPGDSWPQNGPGKWIPRGMGRSYGDAALSAGMLSSQHLNRFLHFDAETGLIHCESGITFADLLTHFVPKGWFPPVSPGTKFVSMGGAIASDVHGKNHHVEGSFADHVQAFDLLLPSGELISCSRQQHTDIFWATFGGMGLTGMILRLRLQLKRIESSAIAMQSVKARNLDEILTLFDEFEAATYSVAWIDTAIGGARLGRSILMKGEHASLAEIAGSRWEQNPLQLPRTRSLKVPFDLPNFTLNRVSVRAFNTLYYAKQRRSTRTKLVDYEGFFYPLDGIHDWNRIYGKRGFTQYQFVVPRAAGAAAVRTVLERMQQAKMASFLSVLKLFGPGHPDWLSFPMAGYTLTLDFPIAKRLFGFLNELDQIVLAHGGRVYLTKDARLDAQAFQAMYPCHARFRDLQNRLDPQGKLASLQSDRLGLSKGVGALSSPG